MEASNQNPAHRKGGVPKDVTSVLGGVQYAGKRSDGGSTSPGHHSLNTRKLYELWKEDGVQLKCN